MHQLEKTLVVLKPEYDQLVMDVFNGRPILERTLHDVADLDFKMKYLFAHQQDRIESDFPVVMTELEHANTDMKKTWYKFTHELVTRICEMNKLDSRYIFDVYMKNIDISPRSMDLTLGVLSEDKKFLEKLDELIPEGDTPYTFYEKRFFRYSSESYNEAIEKLYPERFEEKNGVDLNDADNEIFVHNFSFQTSEDCNLNCTYCYQHEKSPGRMSFEIGKQFIDQLLADEYGYINSKNSPAIILEFIGGEPLLEIELTRRLYEYFLDQTYKMNHPWFKFHRISLCSNGLLYFDEKVQAFFREYAHKISFNISIDGNKQLHDSCRIQPNGEGSYDVDMAALNHFNKNYASERNSKMTLAPENISYLYDSVVNFINNGMYVINLNCVFEDVWTPETATIEYNQLKKLADYLIENNLENLYVAIFSDTEDGRWGKEFDGNFCFKAGTQVLTPSGNRNIETLKVNDHVLTASGTNHVVSEVHKHKSEDNVVLEATGTFPTHMTASHKVFARPFLYKGFSDKSFYAPKGFYHIGDLKPGDKIGLPLLPLHLNKESLDPKIAYLLGVYIADGYMPRRTAAAITPGYDKDGTYARLLDEAGLTYSTEDLRTSIRYNINASASQANSRFVSLCAECGTGAMNKHFPAIAFRCNIETVEQIIEGYMYTDGHTNKNGFTDSNTVSLHLANDLLTMLRSVGYFPTCYLNKREGTMVIEGRTVNVHDRYEIYYRKDRNHNGSFFYDDEFSVMWTTIRKITPDGPYDVYNITLDAFGEAVIPEMVTFTGDSSMIIADNNSMQKHNEYFIQGKPHTDIKSKHMSKGESERLVRPTRNNSEHTYISNSIVVSNCGGTGSMLSMDYKGDFYPCLRYMPSSIGDERVKIGNAITGMEGRKEGSKILKQFDDITRRTQSNDICYDCPIGSGCAWCSALCFETYATANKRITFHCIQVIAEALANVYYWNNLILAHPEYELKVRRNNVPDSWALKVINQEELDKLKELENVAMYRTIEYQKEKQSK